MKTPAGPPVPVVIPNYGRCVTLARAAVLDLESAAGRRRFADHAGAAVHDEQARQGLRAALRELGEVQP